MKPRNQAREGGRHPSKNDGKILHKSSLPFRFCHEKPATAYCWRGANAAIRLFRRHSATFRRNFLSPQWHGRPCSPVGEIAPRPRRFRRFARCEANASGWLHEVLPEMKDFSWQNGYGAFTLSFSQADKVCEYIARQEIHHRQHSFQDEFVALLKANEIEFDEKYLWR